jgi:competence protein ComEA
MATSRYNWYWTLVIVILIVIIVIGGIIAWSKYSPGQPVEINISPKQEIQGQIYVSGAINIPGIYTFSSEDNMESIMQAAGGATDYADLSTLKLYIPKAGETQEPQRIDINRAEVWLLESLPGIGKTLAQRIVDYRQQNGLFHNTGELLKVAGIGTTTYEQIKNLITVAE